MAGVSLAEGWMITEGETRVVLEGPALLTACVVCEQTGSAPVTLSVTGADGEGPYFRLKVGPGNSVVVPVTVALPWGLAVACQAGEAVVSMCYR